MTSENTLTGRNAKFVVGSTRVGRIQGWTVNQALAGTNEWGDSDSAGYTNRSRGRLDATFVSNGVYDTTDEVFDLFVPGDTTIATLWLDNVGIYWDFPRALNMDFTLVVDVDTEDVEGWDSSWGADGVFTRPGEPGQASRSLP